MRGKIVYVYPDVDYVRGKFYVDYVVKVEVNGLNVLSDTYYKQAEALERIRVLTKDIGREVVR